MLVTLLVQEGVLGGLRVDGVRPELLLGIGIVAAIVATPEAGAVVAFSAGVVSDLFVNTPFGLTALVAAVVAYGAGSIQQGLGASHRWSVPVLTAFATALSVFVWAGLGTVLGLPGLLRPRLAVIAVIVAAANALASIPLAPLMRWALAGLPGSVSGSGTSHRARGALR